jgi:hypothetical protein
VHAFQPARIGQFRQIPADRLQGDAEVFGQRLDRDLAMAPGDLENFRVAKGL